jgi:O-antigen ligase
MTSLSTPLIARPLAQYPVAVMTSGTVKRRRNPLFFPLLFLLLVSSSNVFLINQRISIQDGSGQNMLGLRDVALVLTIMLAMPGRKALVQLTRLNSIRICLAVTGLTIAGAIYAILSGRSLFAVGNELSALMAWVLPVIVAANLKTLPSINKCHMTLVWLGVIVSLLSLAEVMFKMPLVTGSATATTLTQLSVATARSTPSCWPLMIIANGSLLVGLSTRRWKSVSSVVIRSVAVMMVTIASLMTQSRTLLVGMAVCLLGAIVTAKTWRIRALLLGAGLAIPLMITVAAQIGASLLTPDFADYYMKRYSVLSGIDSASEYAGTDGRTVEIQAGLENWSAWFWLGRGVASSYRPSIYSGETADKGQMAHNVLLYFGTRFGVAGISLFLLFCGTICSMLYRAARSPDPHNSVALCLGIDLVSLLAASMFGNIFAMTYMAPVAMVTFGCLVAWTAGDVRNRARARIFAANWGAR